MNKKLEIPSYVDARTYFDYLKLADMPTKHYLMLAELIDNSISSFENKYGMGDWLENLEIEIEMSFSSQIDSKFGYYFAKNSFIKVNDNGFGMDKSELENAVKLNNKKESRSKMNVHGRGLKQSAFYFGIDFEINTNNGLSPLYIKQKLSEQEGDNSPYLINVETGNKQNRGTEIIISNLYNNKMFSHATWKNIKEALEFRYIKYLTSNKVSIKFNYFRDGEKSQGIFEKTKEPQVAVGSAFEIVSSEEDKYNQFKKNVKENIEKSRKNQSSKLDKNTILRATEKIIETLDAARHKQDNVFEFDIDLYIEKKKLKVLFWMLPSKHAKYRGIRLFEGDRAINHAGFQEKETKPYMDWKNGKMDSGSTENRFAGSCNLSEIGLKSKTDKSSFIISDDVQNELDKQIYSVWFVFDKFTMHARKEDKYKKGKKPSNAERDAFENIFNSKFKNQKIDYVDSHFNKKNEVKCTFNDKNNTLWNIYIDIDDSVYPMQIFDKNIDRENYEFQITVFTSHVFWHNIDRLNDFFIEAVYPIALLVVIQNIEFLEKCDCEIDSIDSLNKAGENIFNV